MDRGYETTKELVVECNDVQISHGYVDITVNNDKIKIIANNIQITKILDTYDLTGTELVGVIIFSKYDIIVLDILWLK